MLLTTYLVNLLCAMVECRGSMAPPEAYIAEYSTPLAPVPIAPISIDHLNVTNNGVSKNDIVNDLASVRKKRLFPLFLSQEDNVQSDRKQDQDGVFSSQLHVVMNGLFNSIPSFMNSVSRIMKNSNGLDKSNFLDNMMRSERSRVKNETARDKMPVVVLKNGDGVEGYFMGTVGKGRKIAAYEGLPYAEPPVGSLRFKSPVPKRPWKGIRKAQKVGNTCLQTHPLYFFRVTGDENCLFLNIYTPKMPYNEEPKLFPVLVFIHGGSFMYGSGSEYGPAYLLDQDVILVTLNYRLGALGFLSTGDSESPGNYGLKDQALALKWIHDNIEYFGGDPNRVTISGQSAGGVSAHLHLIANKATDYFHNGMSLSGSGFGFWPVLSKQRAGRLTNTLAKRLNCPYRSSTELIRCLKGISGSWIIMTQLQLFDWIPFHPLVLFAPVVEPEGPSSYLTRWPVDAYEANNVSSKPWIFGQTFKEGHFETYLLKSFMQSPNMAINIKKYLPMILDYDYYAGDSASSEITKKLMEFYDGDSSKKGLAMNTISDMYTDRYFSNTMQKAILAHSQVAPLHTYAYVFDYTGKYNLGQLFGVPKNEWGSGHTEDCMMIFNSSSFHHGLSKRDVEYQLSEIMTNIVSNFVATSEPVYRDTNNKSVKLWNQALGPKDIEGNQNIQYLRFGSNVDMIKDPYKTRVKFWKTLGIPT